MLDLAAGVPFYSFGLPAKGLTFIRNSAASINLLIRMQLKSKGAFPTEVATTKLIYWTIKTYESRYYYFIETTISCSATNISLIHWAACGHCSLSLSTHNL